MCCCSKSCIAKIGLIFSIIFGILSIVTIVLCGIEYDFVNLNWIEGEKYKSLPLVTLISEIFSIAVMILGIIEFSCCSNSKCFGIIVSMHSYKHHNQYLIIQLLALVFCFIISVICLLASDTGKTKDYIGCNTKYKGIFKYWENIDKLFEAVDVSLCSIDCPCDFTNSITKEFTDNLTTREYFDTYVVDGYNEAFQKCPETLQNKVKNYFEEYEKDNGNKLSKLNIKKFAQYWKYIENKFNCVGWCQTTYIHNSELTGNTDKKGMLIKYLFSGLNRGIPKHIGCLHQMIEYVRPRLLAIGLVEFFVSIVMIFTWILAICMLCAKDKTNKQIDT